jgi:hypothetical protein
MLLGRECNEKSDLYSFGVVSPPARARAARAASQLARTRCTAGARSRVCDMPRAVRRAGAGTASP